MRLSNVKQSLRIARSIGRPEMLWGPPGVGKSSIVHQFAAEEKIPVVDWRLTLMDSVDMRGTPYRNSNDCTIWAPPNELPKRGAKPGILFLDELPQARMEVKNVAAMLVLESRIGEWKLPEGWWVVAAGNRATDAAGTSPMPTHLNNRFWHTEVDLSHEDWLAWAASADLDYRVQAWIKFAPDALLDFDPKSKDAAFATPRTWHGTSDILKHLGDDKKVLSIDAPVLSEMISGNVGKARGEPFVGFMRVMHQLVTFDEILSSPATAKLPTEPSVQYAVVTGLTRAVDKKTLGNAFEYVQRIGKEMAFVFARKVELEQPELRKTGPFTKFCAANAEFI